MAKPAKRVYEFDHFCIDAQKRLLMSGETAVPLTPKAFEMPLVLVLCKGLLPLIDSPVH
jgi:DNA-binding response OmpR family regulator